MRAWCPKVLPYDYFKTSLHLRSSKSHMTRHHTEFPPTPRPLGKPFSQAIIHLPLSFHNSVDWSRLSLHVYFLPWLGKTFRFRVFRLLENAFVKLSIPPWPPTHVGHLSHNLLVNFCPAMKSFFSKGVPHTVEQETLWKVISLWAVTGLVGTLSLRHKS